MSINTLRTAPNARMNSCGPDVTFDAEGERADAQKSLVESALEDMREHRRYRDDAISGGADLDALFDCALNVPMPVFDGSEGDDKYVERWTAAVKAAKDNFQEWALKDTTFAPAPVQDFIRRMREGAA
jgi:hypothetical protein